MPGGAAGEDREQLLRRLRAAGCTEEELERLEAEGRLATLAVELALGGRGRHTLTYVARESGVPVPALRDLLQSIGRPNPARGERILTDEDLEAARLYKRFRDAGLPRQDLLELGRVTSQGMAQTAEAVRRLVGEALLKPGDSEYTAGLHYAEAAEQLAPLVPWVLAHQFRAHLRDGFRRQIVTEAERAAGRLRGTQDVAVAFADLVDYTRLGERLPPEDLGRIAGRLAQLAVASVVRPARLVKTIGDAAMFVSPEVAPLVATVAGLAASVEREDEEFPVVRVGVAWGPATTRGGDWYGSAINLASRVTGIAKPGRVLATEPVAEQTPDLPWKRRRRRPLKGVDGRVRLYELEEPAAAT